jgi:hypothetical protein
VRSAGAALKIIDLKSPRQRLFRVCKHAFRRLTHRSRGWSRHWPSRHTRKLHRSARRLIPRKIRAIEDDSGCRDGRQSRRACKTRSRLTFRACRPRSARSRRSAWLRPRRSSPSGLIGLEPLQSAMAASSVGPPPRTGTCRRRCRRAARTRRWRRAPASPPPRWGHCIGVAIANQHEDDLEPFVLARLRGGRSNSRNVSAPTLSEYPRRDVILDLPAFPQRLAGNVPGQLPQDLSRPRPMP